MKMGWRVIYYCSARGGCPILEFIESLEMSAQGKIASAFSLLEEYGYRVGLPHAKKVTGPLWELRLLGNDSLRFLYILRGREIVILHGFKKKKQKIDKRDIDIALMRVGK